ncbi:SirB2 family protein [Kingella negevensis]|uniref:SirB2 family protein n=1 Tax=Kingella negevensis TaxID=1522312 RepID=UPI00050A23D4|nr:SirB2 family protein [Kingella negevensis]MDK4689216.1 SirB2 family protein [Kingella negevensis]WII91429.1 SirB2 family protein [Kingella negevensis]
MESMYLPIRHVHITFVCITILLFNFRFWLRTWQPEKPLHKALKIIPHINDSMLLFTGMLMMQIAHWQIGGAYYWLGTKLMCVLGYIIIGVICLRSQPRSLKSWIAYLICCALIGAIVYLAYYKPF